MKVDWDAFFDDLKKWMEANNVMLQKYSFTSDEYWEWLVKTLSVIESRYHQHSLVVGFLSAILEYQENIWRKFYGNQK